MDPVDQLLQLQQGGLSIGEYVHQFCELSYLVDETALKDIFRFGLNETLWIILFCYVVLPSPWEKQSLFPKWPPAQRPFTKWLTRPVMSAIPEYLYKMAANPETLHKMAAYPESSQVTADHPESHLITADRPEPCQVTADRPEPHHVTADLPEHCHVSADCPLVSSRLS